MMKMIGGDDFREREGQGQVPKVEQSLAFSKMRSRRWHWLSCRGDQQEKHVGIKVQRSQGAKDICKYLFHILWTWFRALWQQLPQTFSSTVLPHVCLALATHTKSMMLSLPRNIIFSLYPYCPV